MDSCDNVKLIGNLIADNASELSGGLHVFQSDTSIVENIFSENTADGAGGLTLVRNNSMLSGNIVSDNTASWGAGGVWVLGGAPTFVNNVIVDNHADNGSALLFEYSSARLLHTTIARNSGENTAVYVTEGWLGPSTVTLTNTVVVSHTSGIHVSEGNTATLEATLWHANGTDYSGNVIHTNDYTGDPAFSADGYHLTSGSAAIDKGVDAGVMTDIDGDSRPTGAGYDLGADEFWYKIYLPLVLRN